MHTITEKISSKKFEDIAKDLNKKTDKKVSKPNWEPQIQKRTTTTALSINEKKQLTKNYQTAPYKNSNKNSNLNIQGIYIQDKSRQTHLLNFEEIKNLPNSKKN